MFMTVYGSILQSIDIIFVIININQLIEENVRYLVIFKSQRRFHFYIFVGIVQYIRRGLFLGFPCKRFIDSVITKVGEIKIIKNLIPGIDIKFFPSDIIVIGIIFRNGNYLDIRIFFSKTDNRIGIHTVLH